MSVFISWSGPRSQAVARALRKYLRLIVPGCQPWMSDGDIDAGKVWFEEIIDNLAVSVGVICVTPENLDKPWLNFEAGALSRKVDKGDRNRRVIPFLLDLKPTDVPPPLSMFMAKEATEVGTRDLVRSIGRAVSVPDEDVLDQFNAHWRLLDQELRRVPAVEEKPEKDARGQGEKFDELLALVRRMAWNTAGARGGAQVDLFPDPERARLPQQKGVHWSGREPTHEEMGRVHQVLEHLGDEEMPMRIRCQNRDIVLEDGGDFYVVRSEGPDRTPRSG